MAIKVLKYLAKDDPDMINLIWYENWGHVVNPANLPWPRVVLTPHQHGVLINLDEYKWRDTGTSSTCPPKKMSRPLWLFDSLQTGSQLTHRPIDHKQI